MKKVLALVLALSMMAPLMTGCGGQAASSAPASSQNTASSSAASSSAPASSASAAQEAVTLKVSVWDNSTTPSNNAIAESFTKANPNIKVELIDIPSAEYTNKLSVMLNGGSDLDAFWIKDADTTLSLFTKGQLADMSEYIKRDAIDLTKYNGLAENFSFDGKQVGMPYRTDWYLLYYNKDLFDAAKVEYPTNDMTWKQFEETAKKLTSGEGSTKNYGALIHTWQACVENWAVADGKHTIMDTDYSFFKPYYEMVLRMQNDDKSIMDFGTMKTSNIHYSGPFLTGNTAMMPMGTWFMATLISKAAAGETKVNWGVSAIPHAEGAPAGQTVGSATPMSINQASKNKDAAWELVKYATGEEGGKLLAGTGGLPAMTSEEAMKIATSIDGMPQGVQDGLMVSSIVLDRPIADKVADVNKMLEGEHGLIMLGERSVDEGLAEMAKRSKEIQGK